MTDSPLLDELAHEFVERLRRGEQPPIEAYSACHPALADEINELFPVLRVIEQHAQTGPGATSPPMAPGPSDRSIRLAVAINALPEDERQVVKLFHLQGESAASIAEALGRRPSEVAGLLRRGLKQLREHTSDEAVG